MFLLSTSPVQQKTLLGVSLVEYCFLKQQSLILSLPFACVISYAMMKLFGLIFAPQLEKIERHSWSHTSAPSTKSSWVPYIISCWLFSESLFGQRTRERWKQQHKEYFYHHSV